MVIAHHSALGAAALDWAQRGLPVFPLQPKSKFPFRGSHGCKDATRDPDTIWTWWRDEPLANIGVGTGDGFFVVDLDGADAEGWYLNACGRHGQPDETLEVRTARGRHIYFWSLAEVPNSAGLLSPKVDVRGTGGYVIAPPSTHPDGSEYLVLVDAAIAEAPRWLVDLAIPDSIPDPPRPSHPLSPARMSREGSFRAFEGVVGVVAAAPRGKRNALLFWGGSKIAAMILERKLPAGFGQACIAEAGRQAGLPPHEIRKTLTSAFARFGCTFHG